ncbi:hypothetical protein BH11ACT8_BH11ACT8_22630 [soil metagenome]
MTDPRSSPARFPGHHVAVPDPTDAELAASAPGTPLEPERDGQPRYVCSCHLVRHRRVLGRSIVRVVWSGVLVPLVGLALITLGVVAVVKAPTGAAVTVGVLLAVLAVSCVAAGRADGHRGWCAARCAAYWFLAFPAVLLGALSAF